MKSISLDNPYLLFLLIPFVIVITLPFIFAIKKGSRNKKVLWSYILHLIIAACVTLALAQPTLTTVMTETEVYVVADVSYSANRNLDVVDGYVGELPKKLPKNSKIGLVCFGRDYEVLVEAGEPIKSVKLSNVDDSGTNIAAAINHASTLFSEGVIKRVVLITDGKETDSTGSGELISAIENLYVNDIFIDAIYLDDNLPEDAKEVQVADVLYNQSTYLGHNATATVEIYSNADTQIPVYLYKDGVEAGLPTVSVLGKGFNRVTFPLSTDEEGTFDYEVRLAPMAGEDYSSYNNSFRFTQTVSGKMEILLISGSPADEAQVQTLYGAEANVTSYINTPDVPWSVEELCEYDEIVISNVDIRGFNRVTTFLDSLNKVVEQFGKSLVTMGDVKLQNKEDDLLEELEDMVPVIYGNGADDPKLYAFVLDMSRSMNNVNRFKMMQKSAEQLLNLLNDEDYIAIVGFHGEVEPLQPPVLASNRAKILADIRALAPQQGTVLGAGLKYAYDWIDELPFSEKQVMLITDGESYTLDADDPETDALNAFRDYGIVTSVINPYYEPKEDFLKSIAAKGGGKYYYLETENDLSDLVFGTIAEDLAPTVIEKTEPVYVAMRRDEAVAGLENATFPSVHGYVQAKAKANTTTVLTTVYEKESGGKVEVPLYVHGTCGKGRVASFLSTLTGSWTADWTTGVGASFFQNMFETNKPEERVDRPFNLTVRTEGAYTTIEVAPATLNPDATTTLKLTLPDGESVEQALVYDGSKYAYKFYTPTVGKYVMKITYSYDDVVYETETAFNVSYLTEYDVTEKYNAGALYSVIRNRGTVSEGEVPTIENDKDRVATYDLSLSPILLIAIAVLYVADVIVRKLRWKDVESFFKKKQKGGAK